VDSTVEPTTKHRPIRDHCLAPSRSVDSPLAYAGRYGRLFPDLPPLDCDNSALLALGESGGPCDGLDGGVDAAVAAGWPFFGQFIAHDITADRSPLATRTDPEAVRNFRTPRANLECLYGAGPAGSPYLYQRDDPVKMLVGSNERGEPADLPRNQEGIALIGDPRNDVHVFVSQLHVALLKVHNRIVDRMREDGAAEDDLFDEAARSLRWHYQWVLVNEYLPAAAGPEVVEDVKANGRRYYTPGPDPFIPFEFADGAFRYGHGQIRERYRINGVAGEHSMFPGLVGFRAVPSEREVDWGLMFDFPGGAEAQRARQIDGRLVSPLINLPREITGDADAAARSLAARDLERGHALGLPSGEAVAAALGVEPLTPKETGLAAGGWVGETPLWLYFLREAAVRSNGDRLGPAGARIVTEVLLGILNADPGSYRAVDPAWTPTLPAASPGHFTVSDLLAAAA
jgi:hypothetical protein